AQLLGHGIGVELLLGGGMVGSDRPELAGLDVELLAVRAEAYGALHHQNPQIVAGLEIEAGTEDYRVARGRPNVERARLVPRDGKEGSALHPHLAPVTVTHHAKPAFGTEADDCSVAQPNRRGLGHSRDDLARTEAVSVGCPHPGRDDDAGERGSQQETRGPHDRTAQPLPAAWLEIERVRRE